MGGRDGPARPGAPAAEDLDEQPWGRSGGRHSLGGRPGSVRVDELVRAYAGTHRPQERNEAGAAADALVEIERLTALLRDTQADLAVVRERAGADAGARRAEYEDAQTRADLRIRELEKQVAELVAELAAEAEDAPDVELLAAELERARAEAEQARADARRAAADAERARSEAQQVRAEALRARAEAEDAGAEADAAFVELAEAFAALTAAEARITELEKDASKRGRGRRPA